MQVAERVKERIDVGEVDSVRLDLVASQAGHLVFEQMLKAEFAKIDLLKSSQDTSLLSSHVGNIDSQVIPIEALAAVISFDGMNREEVLVSGLIWTLLSESEIIQHNQIGESVQMFFKKKVEIYENLYNYMVDNNQQQLDLDVNHLTFDGQASLMLRTHMAEDIIVAGQIAALAA